MMIEPQTKVCKGLMVPGSASNSVTPKRSLRTSGPSPIKMRRGPSTAALSRLEYHESARALPFTTFRLCLMTTEWIAVMAELATPKLTPTTESGVPSRKTPMKNPKVTIAQQRRMRREGGDDESIKKDTQTVKGRTRPRATW